MTSISPHEILVVGGKTASSYAENNVIYIFQPDNGRFRPVADLPLKANFISDIRNDEENNTLSVVTERNELTW
jgi:hypothetical protein